MTATADTLIAATRQIAGQFLHSVVLIDDRVFLGVKEVRRVQVGVALIVPRAEARDVDLHVQLLLRHVVFVDIGIDREFIKMTAHGRNHHVARRELNL